MVQMVPALGSYHLDAAIFYPKSLLVEVAVSAVGWLLVMACVDFVFPVGQQEATQLLYY